MGAYEGEEEEHGDERIGRRKGDDKEKKKFQNFEQTRSVCCPIWSNLWMFVSLYLVQL